MAPISTSDLLNEVKNNFKDCMGIIVDSLRKEMNELRSENQNLRTCYDEVQRKLGVVIQENKSQQAEIICLQDRLQSIDSVSSRVVKLEDNSKQNNLRIDGVKECENENSEQTQHFVNKLIKEKFNCDIQLCSSTRLGKFFF